MSALVVSALAALIRWPLSHLARHSRPGGSVESALLLAGVDVSGLRTAGLTRGEGECPTCHSWG